MTKEIQVLQVYPNPHDAGQVVMFDIVDDTSNEGLPTARHRPKYFFPKGVKAGDVLVPRLDPWGLLGYKRKTKAPAAG